MLIFSLFIKRRAESSLGGVREFSKLRIISILRITLKKLKRLPPCFCSRQNLTPDSFKPFMLVPKKVDYKRSTLKYGYLQVEVCT